MGDVNLALGEEKRVSYLFPPTINQDTQNLRDIFLR
jgi:hypothetical protein